MELEKRKYYFIYQTTNKLNGKYYIGKHETYNLNDGYVGSGILLQKAIVKYGIENFERTILFFVNDSDSLKFAEKETVTEEVVNDPLCYNLKIGGDGGWDFINKEVLSTEKRRIISKAASTKEVRKRISVGLKTYFKNASKEFITEYHKRGMAVRIKKYKSGESIPPFTGKQHSKETKVKIGKANSIHQQGSKNSNYGHHWWMNPETGESHSIKEGDPVPEGWIRGRRCKKS